MADFPIDLTNATDNVTDVLAKHLNNLEAKVGVDNSAVTTSLDYKVAHDKFTWKGDWSVSSVAYDLNDTVQNDGSGYVCISAHTSGSTTEPGVGTSWPTVWDLFVEGTNKTIDGWIPAGETWTYASADDPTFTFTVAADVTTKYSTGMKIKLTQGTVKYFIITAVSAFSGGNTTITVYGGTDYDLASSAISANAYSMMKSPQGFPMSPAKWSVVTLDTSNRDATSPTSGNWFSFTALTIDIPIGVWNVSYSAQMRLDATANTNNSVDATLSTTTNSETSVYWTRRYFEGDAAVGAIFVHHTMDGLISITTKDTYYLLSRAKISSGSITRLRVGEGVGTRIQAVCAYL